MNEEIIHKKIGRPTKYPEIGSEEERKLCDNFIEQRANGWIIAECAYNLNVNTDTIYEWVKRHKLFSEAYARGEAAYHSWLARDLRNNRENRNYNDKVIRLMAATHARWSDLPSEVLQTHEAKDGESFEDQVKREYREGKISYKEYKDMQIAISAEYERNKGDQILAAEETLKQAELDSK